MATDLADDAPPPKKTLLRYILLGCLFLSVLTCSLYALGLSRARQGIRTIEAAGGELVCVSEFHIYDPLYLREGFHRQFKFLRVDRDVWSLDLRSTSLRCDQLSVFRKFPKLGQLELSSDLIGPELKILAEQGFTGTVTLSGDSMDTNGIEVLAHLESLQIISGSSPIDLAGVARLPKLRELNLMTRRTLTSETLAPLSGSQALEVIRLSNAVDESAWESLADCPHLKRIEVKSSPPSQDWQGLSALKRATRLEKLELVNTTPETIAELQSLKQLKHLELNSGGFQIEDLALLQQLPELSSLDIGPGVLQPAPEIYDKMEPSELNVYRDREEMQRRVQDLFPKCKVIVRERRFGTIY